MPAIRIFQSVNESNGELVRSISKGSERERFKSLDALSKVTAAAAAAYGRGTASGKNDGRGNGISFNCEGMGIFAGTASVRNVGRGNGISFNFEGMGAFAVVLSVLPNPFLPREVWVRLSHSMMAGVSARSTISCAILSDRRIVWSHVPKLWRTTPIFHL